MIAINRILLPTDFSHCAERALEYAMDLAKKFDAKLYVLHVLDMRVYARLKAFMCAGWSMREIEEEGVKKLEAALPGNHEQTVDVDVVVRQGIPFLEILRFAGDAKIDLIVMGTHGRTGLAHVLIGSVAERVVRKAPCPVLTVPPKGRDFVMP